MAFFGPFLAFLGPFEMAPMVARHIPKDPKNTLSAKMAVFWGFAKTGNPVFAKKGQKMTSWPQNHAKSASKTDRGLFGDLQKQLKSTFLRVFNVHKVHLKHTFRRPNTGIVFLTTCQKHLKSHFLQSWEGVFDRFWGLAKMALSPKGVFDVKNSVFGLKTWEMA